MQTFTHILNLFLFICEMLLIVGALILIAYFAQMVYDEIHEWVLEHSKEKEKIKKENDDYFTRWVEHTQSYRPKYNLKAFTVAPPKPQGRHRVHV